MRSVKFLISTITLTMSLVAEAQQVQLGDVQLSGNGCPSGSASVTLSPDSSVASILFSAFEITKDASNPGARTLEKSCRIVLPIQVPANYVLVAWKVDYRGFVHIEDPMTKFTFISRPQLTAFQRWNFPVQTTNLGGIRDSEVNFTHNIRTLTGCGSKLSLQVDMDMIVSTQQGMHQQPIRGDVLTSIDSADESTAEAMNQHGMHFHFGLLPCH